MKKLCLLLIFFAQDTFSGNSSEQKPAPKLVNNSSVPLRFIVHYLVRRDQEIILQPGQTYIVPFTPSASTWRETPDIEMPNQNLVVALTIKDSRAHPDNYTTEYNLGNRNSRLLMGRYARKDTWEFSDTK